MFEELTLVKMATSMARHAGARHTVIAENIANADTPGYRARDVKAFSEYVKEAFTPRATRAAHVGGTALTRAANRPEVVVDEAMQPSANGNSVSLEQESVRSVESRGQHALALAIYGKTRDLMSLALRAR